jgi:hypothetical protein
MSCFWTKLSCTQIQWTICKISTPPLIQQYSHVTSHILFYTVYLTTTQCSTHPAQTQILHFHPEDNSQHYKIKNTTPLKIVIHLNIFFYQLQKEMYMKHKISMVPEYTLLSVYLCRQCNSVPSCNMNMCSMCSMTLGKVKFTL